MTSGYRQAALNVVLSIRDARPDDVGLIFDWIVELAEYEQAREQVRGTPQLLEDALFGLRPSAEAVIAEAVIAEAVIAEARVDPATVDQASVDQAPAEPAGFALFHCTFSTWECRPGIWLEDLYVPPAHRRAGVGGALIAHLAGIAVTRGYTRLQWAALDWNTPALDFYVKLGAERLDEWKLHRLDGEALARVAGLAKTD